ncbi:MAG: hypothetical protein JST55_16650 [Bacteroidetes bacterium]|nr:hypothetical protein [Bacteroidota bacterium]
MKIAFITDGNNTLGMGHVYQAITLVSFLKEAESSLQIFFLTKSDTHVIDLLKKSGCGVTYCKDDEAIFEILKKESPDRVIFDKLDVAPSLAQKIKEELKVKLVILTNLTDANKYADVTVMAGMGSNFQNIYSKDKTTGQVQFWGPKYWLLRSEFYEYTKTTNREQPVKNIMLIFGGADQANLSTHVTDALFKSGEVYNITIVLGSAFENYDELNNVLENNKQSETKVNILKGLTEVAKTMSVQDVIFASPGLSFFEALLVGVPVLCFHQNEFQYNAWKGHIPTLDKNELEKLPSIMKNKSFIYPQDELITSMEVGKGKNEIVTEILN